MNQLDEQKNYSESKNLYNIAKWISIGFLVFYVLLLAVRIQDIINKPGDGVYHILKILGLVVEIFMIVGSIIMIIILFHYAKIAGTVDEKNHLVFGVCFLIFANIVGGILIIVANNNNNQFNSNQNHNNINKTSEVE
ncbi:hypothetical protein [Spiroplasma endosymbiont of Aspidapion aeneum]|uniref:hypothetical protein n=1 Tax=Spiroplasma endosymbiont of Aspidapion aeneum TaxID=3066276 RepID=UPI00313C2B6A